MDVVLAVEVVRVFLGVVHTLHLDRGVEQVVLAAAQICDCRQRLERLPALNVHGHGQLAHGELPHMHVMHVDDIGLVLLPDVLLQLRAVDRLRRTLHHHVQAVLESGVRRKADHRGEEPRADGVEPPEVRTEVNDRGRKNHSARHKHVAQNVQIRGLHINVALVTSMVMVVAVRMRLLHFVCEQGFLHVVVDFSILLRFVMVVVIVVVVRVKDLHLNQVEDEAHNRHREH